MKIVLLGTAYPYRGGLATFNERLAREFMAEGHEVELWTFTVQYPSFLFPGKTQYSSEVAPTDLFIRRELNSCNPFSWYSVGRELRALAPDMLVCCYWMAFFAPPYAVVEQIVKSNGKTRCVSLVHNMIPHEPTILDKLFAPYFVRKTDGFVALSDSVVTDIETLDKENKPKSFYPHPIYDHYGELMTHELACAELGLDSDRRYLLFFGLVRAYKGLDLLLDAFAMVKDELKNVDLIVAGEFYEDEDKYRTQIEQNGLSERVIVRNEFVPDADLRKYFGACDLVVQPYKSATQSGVTQVAFHFEKPMLVTNVGGLGEIVHNGKMGYACAVDSNEISRCILDYYNNNRQSSFVEYLKSEKSKYSWQGLVDKFMSVYDAIMK